MVISEQMMEVKRSSFGEEPRCIMSERIAVNRRARRTRRSCLHHWIVETPHGATSRGTCKRCGASRRFPNAAADLLAESRASYRGRWSNSQGVSRPTEITLPDDMQNEEF